MAIFIHDIVVRDVSRRIKRDVSRRIKLCVILWSCTTKWYHEISITFQEKTADRSDADLCAINLWGLSSSILLCYYVFD